MPHTRLRLGVRSEGGTVQVARLMLTLACGDYDRTRALYDGRVVPDGIDLTYLALEPEEIFWRMLRHREFDASEMSMAMFMMGHASNTMPFVAVPVFPSRAFRHSAIYINAASGIHRPEQLVGRRVGVVEYAITAAVWVRGILQDEYGVRPEQVCWVTGGQEQPGREDKVPLSLSGVQIERAPQGRYLSEMLLCGDIDVLVAARVPSCYTGPNGKVQRLFAKSRQVEQDYFARTGIFPIMHTVVLRKDIYDAHPWAAQSLVKAFVAAKNLCYNSVRNTATLRYLLPWTMLDVEEMHELMGDDPWPYGWEPNRKTMELLARYLHEQGLTAVRVAPEQVFASNTMGAFRL